MKSGDGICSIEELFILKIRLEQPASWVLGNSCTFAPFYNRSAGKSGTSMKVLDGRCRDPYHSSSYPSELV